ncbi:MAG: hypothetical protein IKB02_05200 [Clostridia bacterium]|nr:hypothetical protein [Clostridia bacterium]
MKNTIKSLIEYYHTSVEDVANSINMPVENIMVYYNNKNLKPSMHIALAIAQHFSVDVRFIFNIPYICEKTYEDLRADLQVDLQTAGDAKEAMKFKYLKGYYPEDVITNCHKKVFIAMSFDFKNQKLCQIRDNIKKGIENTSYEPIIMSEVHSNNYITDDIIRFIKDSQFLVLDTTFENYGAYYEAGFAKGLGKEVIICCKKSVFDKRKDHFDINHINHVLWEDGEDLIKQLSERINHTIVIPLYDAALSENNNPPQIKEETKSFFNKMKKESFSDQNLQK